MRKEDRRSMCTHWGQWKRCIGLWWAGASMSRCHFLPAAAQNLPSLHIQASTSVENQHMSLVSNRRNQLCDFQLITAIKSSVQVENYAYDIKKITLFSFELYATSVFLWYGCLQFSVQYICVLVSSSIWVMDFCLTLFSVLIQFLTWVHRTHLYIFSTRKLMHSCE